MAIDKAVPGADVPRLSRVFERLLAPGVDASAPGSSKPTASSAVSQSE